MRHTHSDRLERWLGTEVVAGLTRAMKDFYWPIAVQHGTRGRIFAMPGGDFTGELKGGQECSAYDRARTLELRLRNELRAKVAQHTIWQSDRMRSRLDRRLYAFSTLQDILDGGRKGKRQDIFFRKAGASSAIGSSCDGFITTGGNPVPGTGTTGAAAPGGTVYTSASTGALPLNAPPTSNGLHYLGGNLWSDSATACAGLLLVDRLFGVAKTMNSTTAEAVSGVPTRYTSTTVGNVDYIGGNFMYPRCGTILPATAHNWTVCQYTDQAGNATQSNPSMAGVSTCLAQQIDLLVNNWFMPLAAGDVGVKDISQIQCDTLVATGAIEFVIAHPLVFMPTYLVNTISDLDGISPMSLATILDNACLAVLETSNTGAGAATYSGQLTLVSE